MNRTPTSLLCSFALLFACSGTPTEPEGDGTEGGEQVTTDEGERAATESDNDTTRAPSACPRSFGDASPTCAEDDFPVDCTYPEGTCGCRQPAYCGGAAPPFRPRTWMCEATPVPCPAVGTACSGAGRCSNQACGWQGVACQDGVWTPYVQSPPP